MPLDIYNECVFSPRLLLVAEAVGRTASMHGSASIFDAEIFVIEELGTGQFKTKVQ